MTKPREKTREELQAEIEDGKKIRICKHCGAELKY